MKRPITPKRSQTTRPKITTSASVKVRRPACNHAPATRPSGSGK